MDRIEKIAIDFKRNYYFLNKNFNLIEDNLKENFYNNLNKDNELKEISYMILENSLHYSNWENKEDYESLENLLKFLIFGLNDSCIKLQLNVSEYKVLNSISKLGLDKLENSTVKEYHKFLLRLDIFNTQKSHMFNFRENYNQTLNSEVRLLKQNIRELKIKIFGSSKKKKK